MSDFTTLSALRERIAGLTKAQLRLLKSLPPGIAVNPLVAEPLPAEFHQLLAAGLISVTWSTALHARPWVSHEVVAALQAEQTKP